MRIFLVKGKNRRQIACIKQEIGRYPKIFNVEKLRKPSIIMNYQQQPGKEFDKFKKNEQ